MTKVEAIIKVMQDNGGLANWTILYNETEKYYPNIKRAETWQFGIRGVLYREVKNQKNFKKIDDGLYALIDFDEDYLVLDEDRNTESSTISKMRIGQDKFRNSLLKALKSQCPVTQINDERLLIASHIKPWALSNNNERLDTNNGFLLSIMIDRLFDKGFITFSFKKEILISNSLSNYNAKKIGIYNKQIIENLPLENSEHYLEYHHNKVFSR